MSEHRIYNKKFDINTQNTVDFYNARAKRLGEMDCPYTAVLLGDQNPKHAEQWNIYEKENILPLMNINASGRVLDIGCGMGRWAESIIPVAEYYYGVDFSCEMIKIAKERCNFIDRDYDFVTASFQEAVSENASYKHKFNRVIMCGVCMYINDADLSACMEKLNDLLDEHCIMYFTETVAVENRLTLNECESVALKATYDVIYRTTEEYNSFYSPLIQNGFKITHQAYLPHLNNEKGFSETDRWFTILER